MTKLLATLTNLFALWVVIGTAWAIAVPAHFTWFLPWIPIALGVVMLGMGLTLRWEDFREVGKRPVSVFIGVAAQFLIMPSLAFGFAKLFQLDRDFTLGLILVGCCPGGTASNVIAYLSGAHVPLSVLMTMTSTLASVVLTPLLTFWLGGLAMGEEFGKMVGNMVIIVLLPVLGGMTLNYFFPSLRERVGQTIAPLISVLAITMIVACVVALNLDKLKAHWQTLLLVVLLFDLAGFALGYLAAKLLRQPERFCRTVCIEVGMQNSGLAVTLAGRHFPAAAVSVPGAIAAVYHCLLGSLIATIWRRFPPKESA
ncbi:MAG: BASS family bile acid:Na+ symporter [Verrucomicrobiales bacterium]|jgi:BASS family bile acid:Na+ symporter